MFLPCSYARVHTYVKKTKFQLEEISDTDVDEKCNYSREDANQTVHHPAHDLCVFVRLMNRVKKQTNCQLNARSLIDDLLCHFTYKLRVSSNFLFIGNIVADVIIQTLKKLIDNKIFSHMTLHCACQSHGNTVMYCCHAMHGVRLGQSPHSVVAAMKSGDKCVQRMAGTFFLLRSSLHHGQPLWTPCSSPYSHLAMMLSLHSTMSWDGKSGYVIHIQ